MIRLCVPALLGSLAGAVGGLALAAGPDWGATPAEFVPQVFERLNAQPVDCPPGAIDAFGPGDIFRCARLRLTVGQFKKAWRKAVHKGGGPVIDMDAVSAWKSDGERVQRFYRSDITPITVRFLEADGLLLIARGDLIYCDSHEWRRVSDGIRECGVLEECVDEDRFRCPVLTRKGGRLPYFGPVRTSSVDVKAIIGEDGSVRRICIDKTVDKTYNVIFPFVIALRKREYAPATLDGRPIPVIMDETYWIKTGY